MIRICFTGHRPNRLFGYDICTKGNQWICQQTYDIILEITEREGYDQEYVFYHGGALGYDNFSFEVIQKLKLDYPRLKVKQVIAIPFKKQYIKWNESDILDYFAQMDLADEVIYVDKQLGYRTPNQKEDIYYSSKMTMRNLYMVNHSDIVIGCYDGSKGGTYNCLEMARDKGREIIIINPKDYIDK